MKVDVFGLLSQQAAGNVTRKDSKERGGEGLRRVSVEAVAQGADEMPVPELADAGYWRSWTVTQTGIYYVAHAAQPPYQIMRYDFSTNRATEIATTDKTPLWTYPGLSASPDGKTILYAQQDQNTSSIMLAEVGK